MIRSRIQGGTGRPPISTQVELTIRVPTHRPASRAGIPASLHISRGIRSHICVRVDALDPQPHEAVARAPTPLAAGRSATKESPRRAWRLLRTYRPRPLSRRAPAPRFGADCAPLFVHFHAGRRTHIDWVRPVLGRANFQHSSYREQWQTWIVRRSNTLRNCAFGSSPRIRGACR
jgi:hypothetical protein